MSAESFDEQRMARVIDREEIREGAGGDRPALDFAAGVRYVDDFERRNGEWKIFTGVRLVDWTRTDPVSPKGWRRPDSYTQPPRGADDPVFSNCLRDLDSEAVK